jgi:hypothetical protein
MDSCRDEHARMGNMVGSMVVYGLLIALCAYIVRTWVRWSRAEVK